MTIFAKGWTQGAFARDKFGNSVNSDDPEAISWCIVGACSIAKAQDGWIKLGFNLGKPPMKFNDTPGRTQEEVIAALEAVGL